MATSNEKRLVQIPGRDPIWIEITPGDRLRCMNQLPHRWPEMLRRRENGESVESLYKSQRKLPMEEFRTALSVAYGVLEQQLFKLAEMRAREQWRRR